MRGKVILGIALLCAMAVFAYGIWPRVFPSSTPFLAKVAFLDIGQGDAIFIEANNGAQMLIDAGAGSAVLRELPKRMGLFDRSIDIVLATHPDADHIGGIEAVLSRYAVEGIVATDAVAATPSYAAFKKSTLLERSARANVRKGSIIHLSPNVSFEVVYPEGDISGKETNDASIVGIVHAGDIDFLLTADAPQFVERELVKEYGKKMQSEVLKAGHHGSKTSTSPEFIEAVKPEVAIISAGKDNRYGHPHQETLDTLAHFGVMAMSTIDEGTIVFATDGTNVWKE